MDRAGAGKKGMFLLHSTSSSLGLCGDDANDVADLLERKIKDSFDCASSSIMHRETVSGHVLPRLVGRDLEVDGGHRQVVAFHTAELKSLQLFRSGLGAQLLPIPVSVGEDGDVLIVNIQSLLPQLYLSYFPSNAHAALTFVVADIKGQLVSVKPEQQFSSRILLDRPAIRQVFSNQSFVEFDCFSPEFADTLVGSLGALEGEELMGPVDYRHYYTVDLTDERVTSLLGTLSGDHFHAWIAAMTGLSIAGLVELEVRHLKPGCYQIFNDRYAEPNGLDVVITLVADRKAATGAHKVAADQDGGCLIYLAEGEEVARIAPKHNTMALAYRVEGCNRFMALVCENVDEEENLDFYQLHMTFMVPETA